MKKLNNGTIVPLSLENMFPLLAKKEFEENI